MPRRMLIDASHPEETRVVVLDGQKVEEFDFEAASKRPLKGNIYLAKVTRVEPSLQAAFVEYGGNRQGFLAFSEIHPDYYQIPVADRMAILKAQTERMMAEEDFDAIDSTAPAPRDNAAVSQAAKEEAPPGGEGVNPPAEDSGEVESEDAGDTESDIVADADVAAPESEIRSEAVSEAQPAEVTTEVALAEESFLSDESADASETGEEPDS